MKKISNMTREEAIAKIRQMSLPKETMELLIALAPELTESENERIRKALVWHLMADVDFVSNGVTKAECLAYLEKQKESEGMITVSKEAWDENAKDSFERGIKVGMIRQQKEQKLDSITKHIYSKDDITFIRDCANILTGNDFPTYAERLLSMFEQEEQKPRLIGEDSIEKMARQMYETGQTIKEQKPILKFKVGDKIHLIDGTSPNYEDDCITIREIGTVNYIGEFKEGYVPIKEQNKWELVKEQKPAEWSEEDEKMLKHIISDLREFMDCETDEELLSDYEDEIVWLKSLRPSWKPSEELMSCLERVIAFKNPEPEDIKGCEELLEQLKKL